MRLLVLMAVLSSTLLAPQTPIQEREATRPPRRLGSQGCDLPPALRGVTGHALFRYTVNEAGKVSFTKNLYTSAVPAERQRDFAEAIEACLRSWQYKPALFVGKPYAMELLLGFHFFRPAAAEAAVVRLPGGRSVPRSQLEEMRQEKLELATALLRGVKQTEVAGDAWVLRADVTTGERRKALDAIALAEKGYRALFPDSVCSSDAPKVTLLLFKDREKYNEVVAFDNVYQMRLAFSGQYEPSQRIGYTTAGEQPVRIAANALAQFVSHHLVHQCLFRGKVDPPFWVGRGIATFLGLLKVQSKEDIDLSRFETGKQADASYRWVSASTRYLETLERHDRAGTMPNLGSFLAGGWDEMEADLAEGLSWILIHYLVNAEQGKHWPVFRAWVEEQVSGESHAASIATAVGRMPVELQADLRSYRGRLSRQ